MKEDTGSAPSGEKLRYITEDGKPVAVIIDLDAYHALRERLEDLEDALDLKKAIADADGFSSLEEMKKDRPANR